MTKPVHPGYESTLVYVDESTLVYVDVYMHTYIHIRHLHKPVHPGYESTSATASKTPDAQKGARCKSWRHAASSASGTTTTHGTRPVCACVCACLFPSAAPSCGRGSARLMARTKCTYGLQTSATSPPRPLPARPSPAASLTLLRLSACTTTFRAGKRPPLLHPHGHPWKKAESEAQRGKPKGTLESESRNAIVQ